MTKELKLDLGCANELPQNTPEEQWVGIDLSSNDPRCHIRDIARGLPFADDTFDYIRAHNFLEHIEQSSYIFTWNEAYRTLKKGGYLEIMVPQWNKQEAFQDPQHVRFFTENSFQYFCDDGSGKTAFNGLSDGYGVKTLFKMIDNNFGKDDIEYFVILQK